LKKYFKIPPNLPFPKGGETLPPLKKGGVKGGIFEPPFSGRLALFKQLKCYERNSFMGTSGTCALSRAVIKPFSGDKQEHWRSWGGEEPDAVLTC
jgi:hypothetical protein